ncbi:MAG: tRNA dihydrouridine synthase DusB [Bacilli bacterium]|nr:tRNA dihydrouridine synthase DusB [Bacilli bacterium]MCI6931514.1 tRNA dihydrouridine synthase DusB [Mycoplasmatota bacterium]
MKWKIGNVEIKNQVVLAPMAGISNTAYRQIIKEMGAGLIFAEMVSDKALVYGSEKTFDLLKMSDMERPIAQQIFGSDVDSFVKAAKLVEDKMHPDIIDINMGCPVPKVAIKSQAGSALLKNPDKIKEIVSAVVKAVSVPVTVKIRSGWDANSVNAVEVAKVIEEAGASAITVHGRTRAQGYSGNADWNIIKQVKEMVSIPVIGNGDITSAEKAKEMLDFTGCDAVMIGRGVLGNPWLIKECVSYLESGIIPPKPSAREKIEMLKRHYQLLVDSTSEKQAILEIRTHALWYIKGMPKSAYIKNEICKTKNSEDLFKILNDYLGDLDD